MIVPPGCLAGPAPRRGGWERLRRSLLPGLGVLLLGCATTGRHARWDREVRVHGTLRAMLHEGQIGAQVGLGTLLPDPDLYALGALADLAGEVTIIRGQAYLANAEGADRARTEAPSRPSAGVALLVAADVREWIDLTTERALGYDQIDDEIARLAAGVGLDLDAPFPFLLEGEFEDLEWHVVDGRRLPGGTASHEEHQAAAAKLRAGRTRATLLGFHSRSAQGIFTHRGSATHMHCVVAEPLSTGHVDGVIIPAGTRVAFPLR